MFLNVILGGLGTEDEEKERSGLTISGYLLIHNMHSDYI